MTALCRRSSSRCVVHVLPAVHRARAAMHILSEISRHGRCTAEPAMKRILVTLLFAASASAQTLDVPVVDVPYNTAHGLRAPSMQQSLALSASAYDAAHLAIQDLFGERHPILGKI